MSDNWGVQEFSQRLAAALRRKSPDDSPRGTLRCEFLFIRVRQPNERPLFRGLAIDM